MYRIMMRAPIAVTNFKTVTGATLIEVMVALLIMSIGLLGLASLQLSGVNTNSNSEKRTQAAFIANDMVERMRANPTAVAAGAYDAALNNTNIDCAKAPANICEDRTSASANCTTAQMATFDVFTSYCNAKILLPSGSLSVWCSDNAGTVQSCAGTVYRTVRVNWINQIDGGSENKFLTMTVRP